MYIRRTNSGKYEVFVDIATKGSKKRKRAIKTFPRISDARDWGLIKECEKESLNWWNIKKTGGWNYAY